MPMPVSLPVVIGGDLNTHVGPGGHDDASRAAVRDGNGARLRLGRRAIWRSRRRAAAPGARAKGTRQLDWFCTRGLTVRDPPFVPALGDDASVLSDHELITADADELG